MKAGNQFRIATRSLHKKNKDERYNRIRSVRIFTVVFSSNFYRFTPIFTAFVKVEFTRKFAIPLKTGLQILVEELQKEYDYLEGEMKDCINEWEFEEAEALKKPLTYTGAKLQVLKNLENPHYDQIQLLKGEFEHLRDMMLNEGYSEEDVQELVADIEDVKERISAFESIDTEFRYDSDHLIQCLERIISGEIRCFELMAKQEEIGFEICRDYADLIVNIKTVYPEGLDYFIAEPDLMNLKRMGFKLNEETAEKRIANFGPSKILDVLQLLGRVSFEVLRLYRNPEAVIIIKD